MRQKGFTLIEVLVVLVVGGVLLIGVMTSIFQVTTFTSLNRRQGVTLADLQLAALYITKDLQMAKATGIEKGNSVVLSPQNSANVTIEWFDYTSWFQPEEEQFKHSSIYSFSDSGKLERAYGDDSVSIVGRYITYVRFTQQDDRFVNVVITATYPDAQQRSKTIEFSVSMRPEDVP